MNFKHVLMFRMRTIEPILLFKCVNKSLTLCYQVVKLYFEGGYLDTKVYSFGNLPPGSVIPGPCVIMDNLSTIIVDPFSTAFITKYGNIKIELGEKALPPVHNGLDNIQLSIFSHRFMSIAEQMGRYVNHSLKLVNIFALENSSVPPYRPISKKDWISRVPYLAPMEG